MSDRREFTGYLAIAHAWDLFAERGLSLRMAIELASGASGIDSAWIGARIVEKQKACAEARDRRDEVKAQNEQRKQREAGRGAFAEPQAIDLPTEPRRAILVRPGAPSE